MNIGDIKLKIMCNNELINVNSKDPFCGWVNPFGKEIPAIGDEVQFDKVIKYKSNGVTPAEVEKGKSYRVIGRKFVTQNTGVGYVEPYCILDVIEI